MKDRRKGRTVYTRYVIDKMKNMSCGKRETGYSSNGDSVMIRSFVDDIWVWDGGAMEVTLNVWSERGAGLGIWRVYFR